MTTVSHRALSNRRRFGGLLVALSCLVAGGGCASTTYVANDLPIAYSAKSIDRLDKADLSRLTSYTVRSDQIGAGDLLTVTVFSDYGGRKTVPSEVNVAEDGTADIPMVGPVHIGGRTCDGAAKAIAEAARERDVYRTPHVSVKIERPGTNRITVSGAVNQPGVYEIPRGNSTLLGAILEAGDLAEDASPDVTIRRPALSATTPDAFRGNPLRLADGKAGVVLASYEDGSEEEAFTIQVDLVSASVDGKGGYYLDDGDIVHVKKRPERKIHVMGLVNKPDEFEMPPNADLYLLNAIALAGGRRLQAADSVRVIRRVPGEEKPITIKASVRDAQNNEGNILLQENDVVIVEETPVTIAFETLKTFFRFSVGSSLALF